MAHKLARLIYRMLKFGADYVDKGIEAYESRYRHQQMKGSPNRQPHLTSNSFHHRKLLHEFLGTVCHIRGAGAGGGGVVNGMGFEKERR
jgi:hypothetical protein